MFSTKRLKKKSQSVDIASQGFSPTLLPASPLNRVAPPVAKATAGLGVQDNNTTNSQHRSPRCGELKRGYTIDTGQKKTPEKKDGRRMSFQRPKGTIEYSVESRDTLNSISLKFDTTPNKLVQLNKLFSRAVVPGQVLYVPDPEYVSSVGSSPSLSPVSPLSPSCSEADLEKVTDSDGPSRQDSVQPPVFPALRKSRVVSSTSEEEEALTEKFLKINCKYITDGKGAVSGVLLVTPNNIMFDPHRMDPMVQAHGCEEYGIMCPLEEVQSAAIYKEITDPKIRETVPDDLEPLPPERHPSQQKDPEHRLRDSGANDSGSTAPRSTEGSVSEDVFTESELSPIREEEQASNEDLRLDKSSGTSTESVLTITQVESAAKAPDGAGSSASQAEEPALTIPEDNPPDTATKNKSQSPLGSKQHSEERPPSTPTTTSSTSQGQDPSGSTSRPGSQSLATPDATATTLVSVSPKEEANEMSDVPKTDNMQQDKEEKENMEETPKQNSAEGTGCAEKKQPRSHKFLCLRVGKPMKKTFVSNASASMQQYAQQGKKHEYWFAVPQERSDHLYVFFMQWSPDMYGEGVRGMEQEPGFMVVKKNEVSESAEDEPITDLNVKEWEVVSLTEYHRRIDALNSEDLRSLCKRLQITTKEEVNSQHGPSIKAELEPETFKPNLKEASDLLEAEQIEKLAKNLPPRTIGYPWTLAFSTSKHGMSIKTLYRAMQSQDTPVLMVIKDSDGQVFGALASEPFKVSDGFYGTGETFLFTFNPEFEVYRWTGDNMFFIKGDMDSLAFGGGSGEFGLWLDGDLYHGRSHSCKTFGNPMLSKKEDFYVQDIEIWTFE
ncbi:oxidation resistance protein 1a isoform X2 [Takifugu flavidus]|uniref:oxidation resistance protein 1a isoform X2 n=1 Tax=Takifugu flavidus TaxID=433684 RepID=UPI002544D0A3|nr:oxidation resistance protein 1a isoform X2 [Takifugu flavidus]XP_056900446.1 oxidation resistance protein 1a isoform X2 [Takifugu flavidus]XP_056900447.1 oxidation resistance protein 1a isoform X2 [Takifugu flavidus]